MVTRAQKIRLAVFFIIGFVILLIIVVMLLGSKLTERRDSYRVVYDNTSVAGLQIGGGVLYHGIRIGRIDDIEIDRENITSIIVHISVKYGTPIKSDQVATMVNVGITGLKQIELSGGSNEASFLKPGDKITAGKSLFDNISDTAEALTAKIERIIDNIIGFTDTANQEKLANIIANIDTLMAESRKPLESTVRYIENIAAELSVAVNTAHSLLSKIDEIFEAGTIDNIIVNTETITKNIAGVDLDKINVTMESLNETIAGTNRMIARIEPLIHKSAPEISSSLEELRETLENLNEFSRILNEDPSIIWRGRGN